MQERDLSNRFLEFRSLQLKWGCQVAGANLEQEWLDGWRYEVENNVFQDDVYDVVSSWLKMISIYTSRNLTVATDRILAISGIAEAASKLIQGEYWAGLWESNLPLCLMRKSSFHTYDKTGKLLEPEKPIPRPAEYQGPSWSWVSVNTKAHYYLFTTRDIDICVEVLGCDIKLADERAMYGAVKAAQLRICGRVMPGLLYYSPNFITPYKSRWTLDVDLAEGHAYASGDTLEPEFASLTLSPIRVHLLEVIRRVEMLGDDVRGAISEGLILRQLPSQQYSRLGTFSFYHDIRPGRDLLQKTWFDRCDKQILCLV